jgi:hypothetical protein
LISLIRGHSHEDRWDCVPHGNRLAGCSRVGAIVRGRPGACDG